MKKHLLLFAALLFSAGIFSQDKVNLVVFSEDGDAFYTYINGVKQNDKPESNVRITGISPNISLRIVFENKALPEIKRSMALEPGFEHTTRIKKDTKQQVKLRYFGQTPIGGESAPGVTSVAYHSEENPVENTAKMNAGSQAAQTTVTSTTTTTTKGNVNSENVSVNVNMAGVGIQMNVTGIDDLGGATMNSSSSTTVTSTTTSSGYIEEETVGTTAQAPANTTAKSGCSAPMSPSSFSTMKKSVESKPFSDTKMSTAKIATKNACLSVNQVKEICKLFSMDDEKLTYAKYAYNYCVDKANYYQVGDVFSFSGTTEDFNKFLED